MMLLKRKFFLLLTVFVLWTPCFVSSMDKKLSLVEDLQASTTIDKCSVCFEYLTDQLHETQCNHRLHTTCYERLVDFAQQKNRTLLCPLCRFVLIEHEETFDDVIQKYDDGQISFWSFVNKSLQVLAKEFHL